MTDPNTHINYTLEDIERYIQGGMTAKEMHDMERAALQNSFLADAIDGYNDASPEQSRRHLNEITALLQQTKEEAKVIAMPAKNFGWWRVAATIAVIVGASAFSLYIFNLNKPAASSQELAVVKQEHAAAEQQPSAVTKADTERYIAQNRPAEIKSREESKESPQFSADADSRKSAVGAPLTRQPEVFAERKMTENDRDDEIAVKTDSLTPLAAMVPGVEVTATNAGIDKKVSPVQGKGAGHLNKNILQNQFTGRITDSNNTPVPDVLVSAGKRQATLTDANGQFKLQAPDTALQVSIASAGYETESAKLQSNKDNNIQISPSNMSLSEVVVTGYGIKKKTAAKPHNNITDTAFPDGGWESFQQYVYRKMNKPFDSSNNDITMLHGNVEIEFSINKNGEPYNFKVLNSSDKEAEDKAIDALKNGPRWISSNKYKKGKVVIHF